MCRVLYLEDEPDLVESMTILLKKRLDVTGTTSIPDALAWLADSQFDVVLLDVMMPPSDDMDPESVEYGRETGVEVARRVKLVQPEVPIVALTVSTDREIWARLRAAGVVRILNKPIDLDPLIQELLLVARRKSGAPSSD